MAVESKCRVLCRTLHIFVEKRVVKMTAQKDYVNKILLSIVKEVLLSNGKKTVEIWKVALVKRFFLCTTLCILFITFAQKRRNYGYGKLPAPYAQEGFAAPVPQGGAFTGRNTKTARFVLHSIYAEKLCVFL